MYGIIAGLFIIAASIVSSLLGLLPTAFQIFDLPHVLSRISGVLSGTIVYVVSDEIIPESHEHGYQRSATFSLLIEILVAVLMQHISFP